MNENYRKKALERLEICNWQIKTGKILTLGSNLYFALFNFMQAVLDIPVEGKWKHIGINKSFSKYCIENNLYDKTLIKNLYKTYERLYFYRVKADYKEEIYTEEEIKELKIIFEFIKEVIVKWQD